MKRGFFMFMLGMTLGYLMVQGMTYLNQHYLWAFFYQG